MAQASVRMWRGVLMWPLLAGSLALAAPADASSDAPVPVATGASKPRPSPARDGGDRPAQGERVEPQAVDRGASYPGPRRRVFPAE